jgi:hypothetical protein
MPFHPLGNQALEQFLTVAGCQQMQEFFDSWITRTLQFLCEVPHDPGNRNRITA